MHARTQHVRRACAASLVSLAALSLSACGSAGGYADDKLTVVASTSVWGSIAASVGGDSVRIESIIADPSADPRSYESTPRDAALVSKADLVVFNGGGYDPFVEKILTSQGKQKRAVRAVDSEVERSGPQPEAGHDPEPPGESDQVQSAAEQESAFNEHVWYDTNVVQDVADQVASELSRLRPQQAQKFHESAERFSTEVNDLEQHIEQVANANQGKKVLVTEPVGAYLVAAIRLEDITPATFVKAAGNSDDPPVSAVAGTQALLDSKKAAAVINNPQTQSPVTSQIRDSALRNQTPVVDLTETLPPGRAYLQWMDDQVTALDDALRQKS